MENPDLARMRKKPLAVFNEAGGLPKNAGQLLPWIACVVIDGVFVRVVDLSD
jgi:hypothetical protein